MYKVTSLILSLVVLASCQDLLSNCGDNIDCVERELVQYVDKVEDGPSVPLLGDYLLLEKNSEKQEEGRSLQEGLIERCVRYLSSHQITFKIPQETSRSFIAEARSSKLKKILLPILVLLKLKAAIIIPAVLSIIALVAFKGLGVSLIALAISGATGFKNLLEHHGSKISYEVVPQPISSPHWSRSGVESSAQMSPLSTGYPSGYHTLA